MQMHCQFIICTMYFRQINQMQLVDKMYFFSPRKRSPDVGRDTCNITQYFRIKKEFEVIFSKINSKISQKLIAKI